MRYNLKVKNQVRDLRLKGFSLGEIKEQTGVPRTTIRTWIDDVRLTEAQVEKIKEKVFNVLQKGRIKAQKIQKYKRIKKEKSLFTKGLSEIDKLNKRELLIAGVSLYWSEGFKNRHEHRLGFCNSDPEMIRFYVRWLKEVLGVEKKDLVVRLSINQSYKEKVKEIEEWWSKITGISLKQFTKTFYQKTLWKKEYFDNNYHGVLRIHVKDSLEHLLRMRGWIEGLKNSC